MVLETLGVNEMLAISPHLHGLVLPDLSLTDRTGVIFAMFVGIVHCYWYEVSQQLNVQRLVCWLLLLLWRTVLVAILLQLCDDVLNVLVVGLLHKVMKHPILILLGLLLSLLLVSLCHSDRLGLAGIVFGCEGYLLIDEFASGATLPDQEQNSHNSQNQAEDDEDETHDVEALAQA